MSWNRWYRIRSYVRSSLWLVPVAAGTVERIFRIIISWLETCRDWTGYGLGLEGAKALSGAVVTLTLSFIVFTFGSLLVAIQVASGQYTPRVIATTLLRDNVIRFTVGLFVLTFLYCIRTLNHLETTVPQLAIFMVGVLGLINLAAFLF